MNRVQKHFILEALDADEVLSDWEADFINNLADYDEDTPLTTKQNSILNRIHDKIDRYQNR